MKALTTDTPTIGLVLSGGGFRATLFHLGVVRFLHRAGLLGSVTRICSVSGGSILAAHVVLNWERYTGSEEEFEHAAEEIVRLTKSDLRGRIVRRWVFSWVALIPRLFWRHWSRVGLLERFYSSLYKGQPLRSFRSSKSLGTVRPELNILATSMTTGDLCSFDKGGLTIRSVIPQIEKDVKRDSKLYDYSEDIPGTIPHHGVERDVVYESPMIPVSLAVAASSAFPPMFPPVLLDKKRLAFLNREFQDHFLTDGGVFDNLGIRRMHMLQLESANDVILLSDAGGLFDWDTTSHFHQVVARTWRTTDIMMNRLASVEYEGMANAGWLKDTALVYSSIAHKYPTNSANFIGAEEQRLVRTIRTDLDEFEDGEIIALVGHGYRVAMHAWLNSVSGAAIRQNALDPYDDWIPYGVADDARHDIWQTLRRSATRRWRLWSSWDWASWATLALIAIYGALIALALLWVAHRE